MSFKFANSTKSFFSSSYRWNFSSSFTSGAKRRFHGRFEYGPRNHSSDKNRFWDQERHKRYDFSFNNFRARFYDGHKFPGRGGFHWNYGGGRCYHDGPHHFPRNQTHFNRELYAIVRRSACSQHMMMTRAIGAYAQTREFHTTLRNDALPHVAAAVAALKASGTMTLVQSVLRVTLSLFPITFIKSKIFHKIMRSARDDPEKYALYKNRLKKVNRILFVMVAVPCVLFWLTVMVSLERTPLTGRWRVILLSPAEEEEIAEDLRGNRWYDAVSTILTSTSGNNTPPPMIPRSDWRWEWVESTLRRLEAAALLLHDRDEYRAIYERHLAYWGDSEEAPLIPPPPKFPLLPRPRASTLVHEMPIHSDRDHVNGARASDHRSHHVAPHTLVGPPYSLLLVDKNESNAFSYGFGPEGSGGVVVFSGFLDEVLRPDPNIVQAPTTSPEVIPAAPVWSFFSGSGRSPSSSTTPVQQHPVPTPEQTSRLAMLLAHELSHLILSHHIETLSSGTILFPSIVSIVVDSIRTLLYPLTFAIGPFASDALDRVLRVGLEDMSQAGETCASRSLEMEADVISARILALAGFDPREAVGFWENRTSTPTYTPSETHNVQKQGGHHWMTGKHTKDGQSSVPVTHPGDAERVNKLKEELGDWAYEKARALVALEKAKAASRRR